MGGQEIAGGPIRQAGRDASALIADVDRVVARAERMLERADGDGVFFRPVRVAPGTLLQWATGQIEECPFAFQMTAGKPNVEPAEQSAG